MSKVLYEAVLDLVPVSKKNSQRILKNRASGRYFVAPSEQYKDYENRALLLLPIAKQAITVPVNVQTVFYMPTKRRCDLVNMQEAILDILVKRHVLDDDNYYIVRSMDGSKIEYDKERPRTEIKITEAVLKNGL